MKEIPQNCIDTFKSRFLTQPSIIEVYPSLSNEDTDKAAAAAAAAAGTVVGRVAAVAGRGPVGVGQLLQMELPLPADPGVPAGSSQLRRD